MSPRLRPAELAGRWYPAGADACRAFIEGDGDAEGAPEVLGAILPHAGWLYSGKLAAQGVRAARRGRPDADLLLVFGGHLGPRDPPHLFLEGGWETPLGPVPMASELAQDLAMGVESVLETPEEYADDNAVEVLMPLFAWAWPGVPALVLGVPPTDRAPAVGDECADLALRRGFRRPVVFGSTDLTHYGPNYQFAPRGRGRAALAWVKEDNDPRAVRAMEALDGPALLWTAARERNACCPGAAAAALGAARRLGARAGCLLGYTTSYDVRPEGEPSSFVGYAAIGLSAA